MIIIIVICLSVCLSVCLCQRHGLLGWPYWDKTWCVHSVGLKRPMYYSTGNTSVAGQNRNDLESESLCAVKGEGKTVDPFLRYASWLRGLMVSTPDSHARGREFKSRRKVIYIWERFAHFWWCWRCSTKNRQKYKQKQKQKQTNTAPYSFFTPFFFFFFFFYS